MALKMSELIAAHGDETLQFQNLDQCADTLDYSAKKGRTMIKFGTEQAVGPNGMEKLGLVIWLDRKRVAEIVAKSKEPAS